MPPAQEDGHGQQVQALQERLVGYYTGALTANLVCLGDRLGLYAGLAAAAAPVTPDQLAASLKLAPRYVAEWLRQQATAGLVACDDGAECFWLTQAQAECLAHEHGERASPAFAAGGFAALPALSRAAEELLPTRFASGEGIPYDSYGEAVTCGVCRELGVWLRHALVPSLRALPDIRERLEAGCAVADVGCGCGEAVLAVAAAAAASPACTVTGYDISEKALSKARGLSNATFLNPGLEEERLPQEPTFQLAMTRDAVHDMARPGNVLRNVRQAVAPGGYYIVGDMAGLDSHAENVHNHPLAAFLYGFSCHLSAPGSSGLGTLGIPADLMKRMLLDAGFSSADVLESFQHPLNRYYIARA